MIHVSVPATTANLGVGFDTLGMAVNLRAHMHFEQADTLSITGCPQAYRTKNNLVYQSMRAAWHHWSVEPLCAAISIESPIPPARGLGSSSSCVVAGILGAAALIEKTPDPEDVLQLACALEGHPDNVAPALLGGAVCSFAKQDSQPRCLSYSPHRTLRFVTYIPPYEVRTHDARRVVPAQIPLSDAVWQLGRVPALLRGLEMGDTDLIAEANADRLQEPARRRLIPEYEDVARICREQGAATLWISGSGPTLMAVCDGEITAQSVKDALQDTFPQSTVMVLKCDMQGASVESD